MRPPMRRARYRSVYLVAFACLMLGLAEVRLFQLQVVDARDPERSSIYRQVRLDESERRGEVRDARGGLLATSVREVDLRAWSSGLVRTKDVDRRAQLAAKLAELTGADPKRTLGKLEKEKWTLLAAGVRDPTVIAALRDLTQTPGFKALTLETRYVRDYPRGPMFAPLVGWVSWQQDRRSHDDPLWEPDGVVRGVSGVEALCDTALTPTKGARLVERDGLQRELLDPDLDTTPARAGRAVELTVDPLAQTIAETSIDEAVAEFEPDWAQLLVLRPATSEVLAIAQRPTAPQPRPSSGDATELAGHLFLPVHRVYPPGSSFKPFMLGLVLENGAATPDTAVDCENGHAWFGHRLVHDVHPKGELTATEVLVHSSNIGMAKLVRLLVPESAHKGDLAFQPILDHVHRLGFGGRIAHFPAEEPGLLPSRKGMQRDQALVSLAFGQEIAVTSLQMAAACCSIANGGTWRPPRFVHAVEGDDGSMVEVASDVTKERRVFSPAVAATVTEMMRRVVEDGGTKKWRPAGWSMAGKTGTAQNEQHHEITIASYWCFAPVEKPQFLVLVVLNAPKHGRFAADNAGKVAGAAIGRLLERFDVPRDRPDEVATSLDSNSSAPRHVARASNVVVSPTVGEGR
jgi:cell division protein FtsI (penicillin-binding protein 3)